MIQEIYGEIRQQTDRHTVSELCSVYGVSRSGYYKWLHRHGKPNRYEVAQQLLDTYIQDIHRHHPMMGFRSVRDMLALHFGLSVSDPSVLKSMQRLHIHGYVRRGRKQPSGSGMEHIRFPDLLKRNFHASAPMQKVVTDVTYIKHRGKWHYLAAYLDLFNNEILEWELSDSFDNLLAMLSWKASGAGLRTLCANTSAIGKRTISLLSLLIVFTISTFFVLSVSLTENHQPCFVQFWWLDSYFSVY